MSNLDAIIVQAMQAWTQDERDEWDERAAMIEECDKLDRTAAERAAFLQIRRARKAKQ